MVRENNVKIMTNLAIYEKNKGRWEIPMTGFYKGDYVRLKALKSVLGATVSFLCGIGLVVAYQMEYLLANMMKLDYKQLGLKILAVYGIWVFAYWLVARVIYARRYEAARPNLIIYNHNLKKLQELTKKEEAKTTIPKGGVVINDDFIDF